MRNESYIDENEIPMSSCCSAGINHGFCEHCKEHASAIVECQGCKGQGYIFVSEHQNEPCPNSNCKDGYIIIEE